MATLFRVCLVSAAALIALFTLAFAFSGSGATFRGIANLLSGLVPIVLYYWVARGRMLRALKDVSATNIDSLYYLGFLITLFTLLSTAISYGVANAADPKAALNNATFISFSFGLSLIATAAALFGRVDLMQLRDSALDSAEPENLGDVFRHQVLELDEAYSALASAMRTASGRFNEVFSAHDTAFSQHVSEMMTRSRKAIQQFADDAKSELSSMDIANSLSEASNSLKRTTKLLAGLISNLEGLETRTTAAITGADNLTAELASARAATSSVGANMGRAAAEASAFDLTQLRRALDGLQLSLLNAQGSADRLSDKFVSSSGSAIETLSAKSKDLDSATGVLSDAFVKLSAELARSASIFEQALKAR
jgi:hypothetical protein